MFIFKGKQWLTRSLDSGAHLTNHFFRYYLRQITDLQKPLFLLVNYMEGHAPYIRIPSKFLNKQLKMNEIKQLRQINQDRQHYITRASKISESEFKLLRAAYDAQIAYLDSIIKEFISILTTSSLYDNSLITIYPFNY